MNRRVLFRKALLGTAAVAVGAVIPLKAEAEPMTPSQVDDAFRELMIAPYGTFWLSSDQGTTIHIGGQPTARALSGRFKFGAFRPDI
jgi:hypothetical protein